MDLIIIKTRLGVLFYAGKCCSEFIARGMTLWFEVFALSNIQDFSVRCARFEMTETNISVTVMHSKDYLVHYAETRLTVSYSPQSPHMDRCDQNVR